MKSKKTYKSIVAIALARVMLVMCMGAGYSGESAEKADVGSVLMSTKITNAEEDFANSSFSERNYIGVSEKTIVYDHQDNPSYLLTHNENGYMISDRVSGKIYEHGEINPYRNYMNYKKYFGGISCYYIEDLFGFYDIVRKNYVNNLDAHRYISDEFRSKQNIYCANNYQYVPVKVQKILANSYENIQRKSFGNNNGDYENTCTAVALGICLNYMDFQITDRLLPAKYEAEKLSGNKFDKSKYSNANLLHTNFVDSYLLKAASFGSAVPRSLEMYVKLNSSLGVPYIRAEYAANLGNYLYGTNEIDGGYPIMITSTLEDGSTAQFHSMAVYGYRIYSDGNIEWLVHTGWYDRIELQENEEYISTMVWTVVDTATFMYRFRFYI